MSSEKSARGPNRNVRIGKYQILSHIATGGMGAVYRARDTETNEEVALKVLAPETAAKPALLERFRREARHALRLKHENIVTVHEFGEANNTFFLAMELVDGIDLHEYSQRKGPLDPEEARQILLQAACGLEYAHDKGIVHRDVKPSNFLVSRTGSRLTVKLTDLGLAREHTSEEFRVTRAGTTVGTLDYMPPEQARDSGIADARSDLYALGGTWYHLLAAQAPFPKGGLAERLLKIMNDPPPDVRLFNPRVSAATWAVVQRLLAKDPDDRYQSASELIEDLEALAGGPGTLSRRQELAQSVSEEVEPARDSSKPPGSGVKSRRRKASPSTSTSMARAARKTRTLSRRQSHRVWFILGGAASLFLISLVLLIVVLRRHKEADTGPAGEDTSMSALPSTATAQPANPQPPVPSPPSEESPTDPPDRTGKLVPTPARGELPRLYTPASPFPLAELHKMTEAAWERPLSPSGAPLVLSVSRSPLAGIQPLYSTVEDALAATVSGRPCIVQIHDNGPIFVAASILRDRHITLRAAEGFRPLLCWDVDRPPPREAAADASDPAPGPPRVFLDVQGGSLTIEGIGLAVRWPNTSSEGATLLRLQDADLSLQRCILSSAGRPQDGLTVVRFSATRPRPAPRCRLSHCLVRGADLTMLSLDAPGAEVLIDHSLLVGGSRPLLDVRASAADSTHINGVRSTFIGGQTFLTLRPARSEDRFPRLDWLGWDCLISRAAKETGGQLLQVQDAGTEKMTWRAVNSLYAGWETLLAGSPALPADDVDAWRRQWGRIEGDMAQREPWPTAPVTDPSDRSGRAFRTERSPVSFAASVSPDEPLGCDVEHLPAPRDGWLSLSYDRFGAIRPSLIEDNGPPEVPAAADNLVHGGVVDLNETDLGEYLDRLQQNKRLAPLVVLRLVGKGECYSSPIHFQGKHLVLYFKPAKDSKDKPLSLTLNERGGREAMIAVDRGNLDIMGGTLRLKEGNSPSCPPWMIKTGGHVRLLRCRLEGPQQSLPPNYKGLVFLAGSGDAAAGKASSFAADTCVLMSGRAGIVERGLGAQVFLMQTILVAGANAFDLTLTGFQGKANVQCQLEQSTVAAREAFVQLGGMRQGVLPAEPVVIQSRRSAFLNPFAGRGDHPGLLRYEETALAQGLLIWQSKEDFYDKPLYYAALPLTAKTPERPESFSTWQRLWGAAGVVAPMQGSSYAGFSTGRWHIEALYKVQRYLVGRGADVSRLPGFRKAASTTP